jgi:Zn-dependent oligopeptidase
MARYYSYKWAEVLSADCFGAFEDVGLDDEAAVRATGRRFRDTVLAFGGGRAPEKVFNDFRGRGDPLVCGELFASLILCFFWQIPRQRHCFATAD